MILNLSEFDTVPIRSVYKPNFYRVQNGIKICSGENNHYSAGYLEKRLATEDFENKACHVIVPFQQSGMGEAKAILTFLNGDGKAIQSDYFHRKGSLLELNLLVPSDAQEAILRLMFQSKGVGMVIFENPCYEVKIDNTSRVVRVASAHIESNHTKEDNLRCVLDLIDRAGTSVGKPDIICFTECVYDLRCQERYYIHEQSAELHKVKEKAKENNIFVIFTAHEKDDFDNWYNTAFLISNKGEICGKYRKTHLTWGEYMDGMIPGDDLPVFDTPWGKIGILICWDQWFPEASRVLAEKGAEIIFWLTKGFHEERVVTRARDNGIHYVVCHPNPHNCGVIHATTGKWISRGQHGNQDFVFASVNLAERPNSEYKSFGVYGGNDRHIFLNEMRRDLYSTK